jgi:hypothetical protein
VAAAVDDGGHVMGHVCASLPSPCRECLELGWPLCSPHASKDLEGGRGVLHIHNNVKKC